jgi:hypothetical protein
MTTGTGETFRPSPSTVPTEQFYRLGLLTDLAGLSDTLPS